jgi:hypothetical protein
MYCLFRVRIRLRPRLLAKQSHEMKQGDRDMSGPVSKSPYQGTREKGQPDAI